MRPNKAQRIAQAAQDNDRLLASHIASVAVAIEAIEKFLVMEGIISEGDLMKEIAALLESKQQSGVQK